MAKIPSTLQSNNPAVFPSVLANEVGGHRTVATLADLYKIADTILSASGANDNNDAIGQEWYVVSEKKKYILADWAKRKTAEGWRHSERAGRVDPMSGGVMFGADGSIASGESSFASGDNVIASGKVSTAIGRGARAIGDYSTAIGGMYFLAHIHYIAPNKCRHYIMGYPTYSEEELLYSYVYKKTNLRERLAQIIKVEGDIITLDRDYLTPDMTEIAVDGGVASGHSSVAIGGGHAMGQNSFASGKQTLAKGKNSTSFGEDTQAIGKASIAEGNRTIAEGIYSHAEGMLTVAKGNGSHAEGGGGVTMCLKGVANATEYLVQDDYDEYESLIFVDGAYILANEDNPKQEGKTSQIVSHRKDEDGNIFVTVDRTLNETEDVDDLKNNEYHVFILGAYGMGSHTEGETLALGDFSHAEGTDNISKGHDSHAENRGTIAIGNYSHTEGKKTVALNDNEHAQGKYNLSHSGKTIHSIGIGTNTNTRKNAVEVLNDGRHFILNIGGYDGTNPESSKPIQEVVKYLGRKVLTMQDLLALPDEILCPSGDPADAMGQEWMVVDSDLFSATNKWYMLTNWADRHNENGWSWSRIGMRTKTGGAILNVLTNAAGLGAVAQNMLTKANGIYSHAEGMLTETTGLCEHAQGVRNMSHKGHTIHSIGIGIDVSSSSNAPMTEEEVLKLQESRAEVRKNAQEVMTNGDHYIIGIGGYDGIDFQNAQTLQQVITSLTNRVEELEKQLNQQVK